MSTTPAVLDMWKGFSEELQKIAAAVSVSDVTKAVKPSGLKPAKLTSRPVVKEPDPPSDLLSSARTMTPPPVTAGG